MKQKKESELNVEEYKEFKSRTKKYFIEQKISEIFYGLGILISITILPLFIGLILGVGTCIQGETMFGCTGSLWNYWGTGMAIVLLSVLISVIIYLWIQSNLNKAKERAREELNIRDDYKWL